MSWAEIKKALNSTVGTEDFKPLDEIIKDAVASTQETVEQAVPSIQVSASGVITASVTQEEGYVTGGTKTTTENLPTQSGKVVTPSTSNQTAVESGRYTTGNVIVKGDSSLLPSNIKSGVSVFGVVGTYGGTAEDVTEETEAYTAKIASLESAVSALETELAGKASGGESGGGVMPTCKVKFSESVISNFSDGGLYMTSSAEIVNKPNSNELHYADMKDKFTSISIYDSSSGTFSRVPISSLTSNVSYEVLLGTIIDKGCYGPCIVSGGTVTEVNYDTMQTGSSYLYIIEPVASNIGATIDFSYPW